MYVAENASLRSSGLVRELRQASYATGAQSIACFAGAILLFFRTAFGRAVVIVSSVLGIVYIGVTAIGDDYLPALAVYGVPSLLATILTVAKPTGRWIAAKPGR